MFLESDRTSGTYGLTHVRRFAIINRGLASAQVVSVNWEAPTGVERAGVYLPGSAVPISLPAAIPGLNTLEMSVLHPTLRPYRNIRTLWDEGSLPNRFTVPHVRARLVVTLGTGKRLRTRSFLVATVERDSLGQETGGGQAMPLPWLPSMASEAAAWQKAQAEAELIALQTQMSNNLNSVERTFGNAALVEPIASILDRLRRENAKRTDLDDAEEAHARELRIRADLELLHGVIKSPPVIVSESEGTVAHLRATKGMDPG